MKPFISTLLMALAVNNMVSAVDLPAAPPLEVDFNEGWDATSFAENFTVFNSNNDTKKFEFGGLGAKAAVLNYSTSKDADDWVIANKPITLTAGQEYTFVVRASTYASSATYAEEFEAKLGNAADPSAMTVELVARNSFTTTNISTYQEFEGKFKPETSGEYYFGFHAVTPRNGGYYMGFHGYTVTGGDESGGEEPGGSDLIPETTPVNVDFINSEWTKEDFEDNFVVFDSNDDKMRFIFGQNGFMINFPFPTLEYSRSLDSDDWVITNKPIMLVKGAEYVVKVKCGTYGTSSPEMFEFYAGSEADPSKMMLEVIRKTQVATSSVNKSDEFTGTFIPDATGPYYFGFHATTPKNVGYYLGYHGFSIEGKAVTPPYPVAPGAPTLESDVDGATKVGIRVVAPEQDVLGNQLTELTSIVIYRDGNVIGDASAPAGWSGEDLKPGELTSWFYDTADLGLTPGVHTYYVKAFNAAGESAESEHVSVFVGIPVPGDPMDAVATKTENDGEITIQWIAPEKDADGNALNTNMVSYIIYDISDPENEVKVADVEVGKTNYTYQAVGADALQQLKRYRVVAVTKTGSSENGAETVGIPVGKPLSLPYVDSFAGGKGVFDYAFATISGKGTFALDADTYPASDNDKGVAVFSGSEDGDAAEMLSCEIAIPADATNVILSYYYNGVQNDNKNTLHLLIDAGEDFKEVREISLADGMWHRDAFDLSQYAGKIVRFGFRAAYVNSPAVLIDNIRISAIAAKDVVISDFIVPGSIEIGRPTTVKVNVANVGMEDAADVKVNFYQNDVLDKTETVTVGAEKTETVNFVVSLPISAEEGKIVLRAEAVFDGDENLSDNEAMVEAAVVKSRLPLATGLIASVNTDAEGVKLSWKASTFDDVEDMPLTDSFEEYDAWKTAVDISVDNSEIGPWKTIDADRKIITGSSVVDKDIFPTISGWYAGYFVADDAELHDLLKAHSGNKLLVSGAVDGSMDGNYKSDDWLISPRLSGKEQTIEFYAQSAHATTRAKVEFYQSFTGTDVEDFEMIGIAKYISAKNWNKYDFMVSKGAKYFAIRNVTDKGAELKIDDVTYAPALFEDGLSVVGYNVYCDGELLNTDPVITTGYTHSDVTIGAHKYFVTAIFSDGSESAPSNIEDFEYSGIEAIDTLNGVSITASAGEINVKASADTAVSVYAVDGRIIFSGSCMASGDLSVKVASGVYVVRAGKTVAKVLVK